MSQYGGSAAALKMIFQQDENSFLKYFFKFKNVI